jgi:hypothetical protein
MQHFRLEVMSRAAYLTRRRRSMLAGGIAAALLVAAVLASVGLGAAQTDVRRSASVSGTAAPGKRPAGSYGRYGTAGARHRASPSAPAPGDVAAPGDASATTNGGPNTVVNPPKGTTTRVGAGTDLTVVLPAPASGQWGDARVLKGRGSVVSFVHQVVDPAGGARITLKALKEGLASVEVPCIGDPTGSWQGTVEVTGR